MAEFNSTLVSRRLSACYTVIFKPPLHQSPCLAISQCLPNSIHVRRDALMVAHLHTLEGVVIAHIFYYY